MRRLLLRRLLRFRLLGHSLKIKDKRLRIKKKIDRGVIIEKFEIIDSVPPTTSP